MKQISLQEFFFGDYDRSERLISALEYCSFSNLKILEEKEIIQYFEKGLLYKGMFDLEDTRFIDQLFLALGKFSEFAERWIIVYTCTMYS
jgi:hypothetical protein